MEMKDVILTAGEVGLALELGIDTVRRRAREQIFPSEPKGGKVKAGRLFRADALAEALRAQGMEGQARMLERYVAAMPQKGSPQSG